MSDTLKSICKKIDSGKLLLPDFQRDFKWNVSKQRGLLASIILNFPIGSSLILTGKSNDFASRKIGETEQSEITTEIDCEK